MTDGREMVILRSSEGTEFTLPMKAASVAELVRDSLPEDDEDLEEEIKKVDVIRVSEGCLAHVVEFLQHHDEEPMKEIPTPLGGNTFHEVRACCSQSKDCDPIIVLTEKANRSLYTLQQVSFTLFYHLRSRL